VYKHQDDKWPANDRPRLHLIKFNVEQRDCTEVQVMGSAQMALTLNVNAVLTDHLLPRPKRTIVVLFFFLSSEFFYFFSSSENNRLVVHGKIAGVTKVPGLN